MQSDIEISDDSITGTLKYVSDYRGFSGVADEQEGNYIALHVEAPNAEAITVELVNGNVGEPVTLDGSGDIVLQITDKATQSVEVVATNGSKSITKTFALSDLVLETE